jgi:hypothetical protein
MSFWDVTCSTAATLAAQTSLRAGKTVALEVVVEK